MAAMLMRQVTNTQLTLKASSFVLACERAVCVRSPYSLKSRGRSQICSEPSGVDILVARRLSDLHRRAEC